VCAWHNRNWVLQQLNPTKRKVMETTGVWLRHNTGPQPVYGVGEGLQDEKTVIYTEGAVSDSGRQ
jgi:hypothetical protein